MRIEGTRISCWHTGINDIIYQNNNASIQNFVIAKRETNIKLISPSPIHGRSLITHFNKKTKRYTITKGNGLTYFPFGFVNTKELENNIWGYLNKNDAKRDYLCGIFINEIGVKTNLMEAVFSLVPQKINTLDNMEEKHPCILQYSVECPYRIHDLPFISTETRDFFLRKWHSYTSENYEDFHCIAADIMLKNMNIMHSNNVLHNAIHGQNYTLALELLDFELSRTPNTPYDNEADEVNYSILFNREIIQTLEIVNYLAFFLHEKLNLKTLSEIMSKYGYEKLLC